MTITRHTMRLISSFMLRWYVVIVSWLNPIGEQTNWQSADHLSRPFGDSSLQLQSDRREPLRYGLRVHQPHAAVRMSPTGLSRRRALPEPVLHQTAVLPGGDLQDTVSRLGTALCARHQKGELISNVLHGQCLKHHSCRPHNQNTLFVFQNCPHNAIAQKQRSTT